MTASRAEKDAIAEAFASILSLTAALTGAFYNLTLFANHPLVRYVVISQTDG